MVEVKLSDFSDLTIPYLVLFVLCSVTVAFLPRIRGSIDAAVFRTRYLLLLALDLFALLRSLEFVLGGTMDWYIYDKYLSVFFFCSGFFSFYCCKCVMVMIWLNMSLRPTAVAANRRRWGVATYLVLVGVSFAMMVALQHTHRAAADRGINALLIITSTLAAVAFIAASVRLHVALTFLTRNANRASIASSNVSRISHRVTSALAHISILSFLLRSVANILYFAVPSTYGKLDLEVYVCAELFPAYSLWLYLLWVTVRQHRLKRSIMNAGNRGGVGAGVGMGVGVGAGSAGTSSSFFTTQGSSRFTSSSIMPTFKLSSVTVALLSGEDGDHQEGTELSVSREG